MIIYLLYSPPRVVGQLQYSHCSVAQLWCGVAQYGAAWLIMVWCGSVMVRRGSDMVRRGSVGNVLAFCKAGSSSILGSTARFIPLSLHARRKWREAPVNGDG
jgi:hypothetical protein